VSSAALRNFRCARDHRPCFESHRPVKHAEHALNSRRAESCTWRITALLVADWRFHRTTSDGGNVSTAAASIEVAGRHPEGSSCYRIHPWLVCHHRPSELKNFSSNSADLTIGPNRRSYAVPSPSHQVTATTASGCSLHARTSCPFCLSSVWPVSSGQLPSQSTMISTVR
jgi:hypothetical protein